MPGYDLVITCGVVIVLLAVIGLRTTADTASLGIGRRGARLTFVCFALASLLMLAWTGMEIANARPDQPGVASKPDEARGQLQRIASRLGVSTNQTTPAMANAIVQRLPAPTWHLSAVQRQAFGLALDEVPKAERFEVVVRSIPSNENSIAFAEDVLSVLRQHGWTAQSRREFGINTSLPGILIAVSPSVRSNDEVPPNARKMIVLLQKAGLKPYGAPQPGLTVTQFQLVIGNGPQ